MSNIRVKQWLIVCVTVGCFLWLNTCKAANTMSRLMVTTPTPEAGLKRDDVILKYTNQETNSVNVLFKALRVQN